MICSGRIPGHAENEAGRTMMCAARFRLVASRFVSDLGNPPGGESVHVAKAAQLKESEKPVDEYLSVHCCFPVSVVKRHRCHIRHYGRRIYLVSDSHKYLLPLPREA